MSEHTEGPTVIKIIIW